MCRQEEQRADDKQVQQSCRLCFSDQLPVQELYNVICRPTIYAYALFCLVRRLEDEPRRCSPFIRGLNIAICQSLGLQETLYLWELPADRLDTSEY